MQLANEHGHINLSINPTYFCNFRCEWCYLTKEQLSDKKLVPIETIAERITEIYASGHHVNHADIYGGEITLVPESYMQELKALLHSFGIMEIEIITNLSFINSQTIFDPDFGISVSYDFQHREKHERVFENMQLLSRPFSILTLATPQIVKMNPDDILNELSILENLTCFEVKPYSSNQANDAKMSYREYEAFIKGLIDSPVPRNFAFTNKYMLEDVISRKRNSFSNDHVYITPSGKFGVLEFDKNNREFFLELDSIEDYVQWCVVEQSRVYENQHCSGCNYLGNCLSEHLRTVDHIDESCNGMKSLIEWAEVKWTK